MGAAGGRWAWLWRRRRAERPPSVRCWGRASHGASPVAARPRGREQCRGASAPTRPRTASGFGGGSFVGVLPDLSDQEAPGDDDYRLCHHLRRV